MRSNYFIPKCNLLDDKMIPETALRRLKKLRKPKFLVRCFLRNWVIKAVDIRDVSMRTPTISLHQYSDESATLWLDKITEYDTRRNYRKFVLHGADMLVFGERVIGWSSYHCLISHHGERWDVSSRAIPKLRH